MKRKPLTVGARVRYIGTHVWTSARIGEPHRRIFGPGDEAFLDEYPARAPNKEAFIAYAMTGGHAVTITSKRAQRDWIVVDG